MTEEAAVTDIGQQYDPEQVREFMSRFTIQRDVPIEQMNDVQLRELILEHDQTMVVTSTLMAKFVERFNALASRLVLIETFLVSAMSAAGEKPVAVPSPAPEVVPTGQYL